MNLISREEFSSSKQWEPGYEDFFHNEIGT